MEFSRQEYWSGLSFPSPSYLSINHLLFTHLFIRSCFRSDARLKENLRENIHIVSHYILPRWKENKETFRRGFFFFNELKECPCVAWIARKGKYSSFSRYFLYFKLARNISITGCTECYFKDLELACWVLLPQIASKNDLTSPVSDVYKWHTPLTTHARNVWIPTFLISHSSQRRFFFRAKKTWIKL